MVQLTPTLTRNNWLNDATAKADVAIKNAKATGDVRQQRMVELYMQNNMRLTENPALFNDPAFMNTQRSIAAAAGLSISDPPKAAATKLGDDRIAITDAQGNLIRMIDANSQPVGQAATQAIQPAEADSTAAPKASPQREVKATPVIRQQGVAMPVGRPSSYDILQQQQKAQQDADKALIEQYFKGL